jgi:5'-3' exoribonuclease 2
MDELKAKLKNMLREKSDVLSGGGELEDSVRLGEPGWRERYYREKFGAKTEQEIEEIQRDVVRLPPYRTISHCYYSFFVSE